MALNAENHARCYVAERAMSRIKSQGGEVTCRLCGGSGAIPSDVVRGAALRDQRMKAGVKMDALAVRMGVRASYVSMLENGKRKWTVELIARYKAALKEE